MGSFEADTSVIAACMIRVREPSGASLVLETTLYCCARVFLVLSFAMNCRSFRVLRLTRSVGFGSGYSSSWSNTTVEYAPGSKPGATQRSTFWPLGEVVSCRPS
ncbi:hypothetical protein D3C80_1330780 [compost metagenome]